MPPFGQPPMLPQGMRAPGAQPMPGLPPGGVAPPQGTSMQGSPLLEALAASVGGGEAGDPYDVPAAQQGYVTDGMGTGDPSMGLEQLIQLLALAQMGVGGGQGAFAGQSGVNADYGNIGQASGLGSNGIGGGYSY